jgi:hypothetical protein
MTGVCFSHLITRRMRFATKVTPFSSPSEMPTCSESLAVFLHDADVPIQIRQASVHPANICGSLR